ncbi:MAG: hypothetical protein DDT19_02785 [Syntrophomonadaceae bacterium]|nr:hypothetical protein [Bacillota bacterium]
MPRNTTSSLIKQNFLLLVFLFIALGLFLPLHSAWALGWLADAIATAIVIWIFGVFIAISLGILALAEGLLLFVLSPHFINVPYTTNEFVTLGWTLARDFANMFFIIVLVIIGLATALRISEYQWQKTLPLLIGVALLINFTPVILGLIIDASNIIMNFFVEGITKESVLSSLSKGFFSPLWRSVKGASLESLLAIIITPVFYIIFNLISAIILLLFAVLLAMRYVALWTLVILSPIAFLCYILPATRSVFDMWWKQFLQWCIIGITCAFFLYLGNQLFFSIGKLSGKSDIEGLGLLNTLMPYFVVLAFLFIGFFVSLSTSAMGAGGVIAGAQRGVKATGDWVAKKAWEKGKGWARERIASSERAQQFAQRMAQARTPGTGVPGIRGSLMRIVTGPTWALGRAMGRAVGPGLIETERKSIDATQKKFAGQTVESQVAGLASAATDADRIGILNAIIGDKNLDDAMDVARFGNAAVTNVEVERLYSIAQNRYDKHSMLRAAFPEIARTHLPAGAPPTPPPPGISQAQHEAQYVFDRIRPADYENMSRSVPGDNEFLEAMIRRGTDRHIHRFIDRFQMDGAIAFEQRLHALSAAVGIPPDQFLQNVNSRLHRYFTAGAGQGLIHI